MLLLWLQDLSWLLLGCNMKMSLDLSLKFCVLHLATTGWHLVLFCIMQVLIALTYLSISGSKMSIEGSSQPVQLSAVMSKYGSFKVHHIGEAEGH